MTQTRTAVTGETNVSQSVVEAIAEAEGTDPRELTPPLYDVIDPDALDSVFTATPTEGRTEGKVTFPYRGYEVTVYGGGSVSVEARNE